jgi:hypothetical protein
MDATALSTLLTALDPADLRQRIADIDRQRAALVVLLRAASARQQGRHPSVSARPKEARHVD